MLEILLAAVLYISVLVCAGTKKVKDHERLVVFRFGKLAGLRGPGLVFVVPICETYKKIDMRATPLQRQSLFLSRQY
jgi:regulator of protease activity HflC (stomatin/prohibitin superfamily)